MGPPTHVQTLVRVSSSPIRFYMEGRCDAKCARFVPQFFERGPLRARAPFRWGGVDPLAHNSKYCYCESSSSVPEPPADPPAPVPSPVPSPVPAESNAATQGGAAPAPQGSPIATGTAQHCADEGGTCKCEGTVYLGRKFASDETDQTTSFEQLIADNHATRFVSGEIECRAAHIASDGSDPLPYVSKYCFCKPEIPALPKPGTAQYCADEGGTCHCDGGTVYYGKKMLKELPGTQNGHPEPGEREMTFEELTSKHLFKKIMDVTGSIVCSQEDMGSLAGLGHVRKVCFCQNCKHGRASNTTCECDGGIGAEGGECEAHDPCVETVTKCVSCNQDHWLDGTTCRALSRRPEKPIMICTLQVNKFLLSRLRLGTRPCYSFLAAPSLWARARR